MTITYSKLPNGLRLVTEYLPQSKVVGIHVNVGLGSRHEPYGFYGITHYLEHMLQKGIAAKGLFDPFNTIEPSVFDEATALTGKVLPEYSNAALMMICNYLQERDYTQAQIDHEYNMIYAESFKNTPPLITYRLSFPDSGIDRGRIKNENSVIRFSKEELLSWHQKGYATDNITFSLCGPIRHEDVKDFLERHLTRLPEKSHVVLNPARFDGAHLIRYTKDKNSKAENVIFAFNTFSQNDPDFSALIMCDYLLSVGHDASMLWKSFRVDNAISYHFGAHKIDWEDAGLLFIEADVLNGNLKKTEYLIWKNTRSLMNFDDDFNLKRVLSRVLIDNVYCTDENYRAKRLSHMVHKYDRPLSSAEDAAIYKSITCADIRRVSKRVFSQLPTIILESNRFKKMKVKRISGKSSERSS